MEELSIEEKAKRYDEAMKAAVVAHKDEDRHLKATLERIFPELKESEDERVRKWLIDTIKAIPNDSIEWEIIDKSNVLTWLEKQGEQDSYNGVSFKYNGHTWGMCARDNGVDILLDRQLIKHLEKQGKQEEPQVYKTKDGEIIAYSETDGYKVEQKTQGKSALEAINEEKVDNANKIETKFKDGNVLYSPTHHLIWIYKDNEHYYACVNMNYVTENVAIDGLINIPNDACLATKEQRKQLEKAMADAGYTFDFEKKELKKIEQKPAWSEEYIADVFEKVGLAKIVREQSNDALTIALQDAMIELSKVTLQPNPTAWSEEDEKMWATISDLLWDGYEMSDGKVSWDNIRDWLFPKITSLRYQNTWKPSDEQMDALEYHLKHTNENSRLYKETKKLYDQLKKLK